MGDKVKNIRAEFDKQNFDIKKIAEETGASAGTVQVQLYKWNKENGIVKIKKIKKEKPTHTRKSLEKQEKTIEQEKADNIQKEKDKNYETTITETDFLNYERVKRAGVRDMDNIKAVKAHSGLTEEKIMLIKTEYLQLKKKYPEIIDEN
jgi:hypothetical protein